MRGVLLPIPPVELDELELLLELLLELPVPDDDDEEDEDEDEDDEDELEPEHDCAVACGPAIVIESILAKLSAETPLNTKRLVPAFKDISTLSSTQLDQAPVGAKVKLAALPALPLAVKTPERAALAPLA